MEWVTLTELRTEMGLDETDTRDDALLTVVLNASVAFVESVHDGRYNFAGDVLSELPTPSADLKLGTLMLARRWHARRRSPDALVDMAELGAARVPGFDPDIDRLLRIGRYAPPVFA